MTHYSRKQSPELVEVTGEILRETSSALLIEVCGTGIWFPLSTVKEIHRNHDGAGEDRIVVAYWIAKAKGLA